MLEKQIEKKVSDCAKQLGYLSFKFNSMGCRSVPDRIFISPRGLVILIEFKKLGCKATEKQTAMINKLINQGVIVYIVDNVEDGKTILNKHLESK